MQEYAEYKEKMNKLAPVPEDMRIFWAGRDLARIEARTTYCLECIMMEQGIELALDDMAQIIGGNAPLVDDDQDEIIKALMKTGAVLVRPNARAKGGAVDAINSMGGAIAVNQGQIDPQQVIQKEKSIWDRGYVITTGRDPYEAYVALTVLEKAAEVQIKSKALGGVKPLSLPTAKRYHREYLRKYSVEGKKRRDEEIEGILGRLAQTLEENSKDVPEDMETVAEDIELKPKALPENFFLEFNSRRDLVDYGNKLIEKGLVQGTWGNLSVNLGDSTMVTTPSGIDYDSLAPEDMVKVNTKTLKYDKGGNKPTSEKGLHAGIYEVRPEVGAIVHTHSKYCSIFAACQMPLEVMDESLKEIIGSGVIYIADYGKTGTSKLTENVIKSLDDRKGCILSNHGMIACGKDLEEAFEVAMSLEEAARQLVNHRLAKMVDENK